MTNFGFVINNRTCIGCHACSTACKSENEVPLGVYRTWVKYVETGEYPDSRRHFQVTRCNHCANPPCVRICPVTAMYQRNDGIVEFDGSLCIGCKACLQACPYDAIHIDPETGTAAKCHYCSHRTDLGLEPACVVVCPEHAIIAGDLDDPKSEIRQVLSREQVSVRKPEQGTAPKLFYVDGHDIALHPTAVGLPSTFMWADVMDADRVTPTNGASHLSQASSGASIRTAGAQAVPSSGPIHIGPGRVADHMVQVGYNAQHKVPWHWPVPAYLVTKAIGAGVFLMLALGWGHGLFGFDVPTMLAGGFVALLFTGITTALLVLDLERPERFLSIIFHPQWKSWLTRGAFLLIGYTVVVSGWWVVELSAYLGWMPLGIAELIRAPAFWLGAPLAVGAAIYTAFLFGQAEGRDLWQSTLLPFHLVIQSLWMGAAALLVLGAIMDVPHGVTAFATIMFTGMTAVDLFVTLLGELGMPHASEVAARAAHEISHGRYRVQFWLGSIGLGHVVAFALIWFVPTAAPLAVLAAVVGLYLYEHAFVMAPQMIPNS